MKSILLIGLGRFGRHIAMHLDQLGHQVMAVDNSDERAEDVLPIVTNAQIGDSTNEEFLESLGVRNYDVCIVAIGHDFQSSLETTSLLKDMGAKMVVSRATTDVQEKCGWEYIYDYRSRIGKRVPFQMYFIRRNDTASNCDRKNGSRQCRNRVWADAG